MKVRRFVFYTAEPDLSFKHALAGRVLNGSVRSRLLKERAARLSQTQLEQHGQLLQDSLSGKDLSSHIRTTDTAGTHTTYGSHRTESNSQSQQQPSANMTESELLQKLENLRSEKRKIFSLVALNMKKKSERNKVKEVQASKLDPANKTAAPLQSASSCMTTDLSAPLDHLESPVIPNTSPASLTMPPPTFVDHRLAESSVDTSRPHGQSLINSYGSSLKSQDLSHSQAGALRDAQYLSTHTGGSSLNSLPPKYESAQNHPFRRNDGRYSPPASRYGSSRGKPFAYGFSRYDSGDTHRMPVSSARIRGGFRGSSYNRPGSYQEWQSGRSHLPYEGRFLKTPFNGKPRPKD
ncbi:expressed protein [Batrachochytrium dendrobatidis JAM81]|uniref:Expressed protein n=2 Tax=Batrachochytrium dendrobatidis TaxID=109871 RepID=F4P5Q6_BATDJ|nr:uncharacterized protein BATDEDRAFT_37111 [Batrachochytrium dendrobatidis JAM81]EGF79462.1 expressed protein [Batrachochytrium dendrobatidis JAM81]KAJ8322774.1 hypothetical protein O5D80_008305 [Batrachochytrium dendrobatidis]KAK5665910.1 hypothetical protein QVD99_007533 [Batrachochytrium dendrobatidis]OAJ42849.1 hypothetical protein BDEG_26252 [Batrachochytrium dendrobatidis JEL423]|eukprot:XP_006680021.1 expressed protein [Batrachochytrium dendrobatidis JAM81]